MFVGNKTTNRILFLCLDRPTCNYDFMARLRHLNSIKCKLYFTRLTYSSSVVSFKSETYEKRTNLYAVLWDNFERKMTLLLAI